MEIFSPLPLAARLASILNGLHAAVAARSSLSVLVGRGTEVLAGALILLICGKVRRIQDRIGLLLAKFQAGRLRVWQDGRVVQRPVVRRGQGGVRGGAAKGVPQRLAWLLPLVPCEAANFASQLRLALADPEMKALLAASAQARRVLKPLLRMLGVEAELLTPCPVPPKDDPPEELAAMSAPPPRVSARPRRGRTATARSGSGNPAGCPVPAD